MRAYTVRVRSNRLQIYKSRRSSIMDRLSERQHSAFGHVHVLLSYFPVTTAVTLYTFDLSDSL